MSDIVDLGNPAKWTKRELAIYEYGHKEGWQIADNIWLLMLEQVNIRVNTPEEALSKIQGLIKLAIKV